MEGQLFDVYIFDPDNGEVLGIEHSVEKAGLAGLEQDLTNDGYPYKVVDQFDGVVVRVAGAF